MAAVSSAKPVPSASGAFFDRRMNEITGASM